MFSYKERVPFCGSGGLNESPVNWLNESVGVPGLPVGALADRLAISGVEKGGAEGTVAGIASGFLNGNPAARCLLM